MVVSQKQLYAHPGIPVRRIINIVKGNRGISPDTAWLLSQSFNTAPKFWLNLQSSHVLSVHRPAKKVKMLTRP